MKTKAKRFYLAIFLFVGFIVRNLFYCAIYAFMRDIWQSHSNEDQTNYKKRFFPLTLYGKNAEFSIKGSQISMGGR